MLTVRSLLHVLKAPCASSQLRSRVSLRIVQPDRNMSGQTKPVIFRQLFEHRSFTYTYLIGDPETRDAVLIDPVIEMVDRDLGILRDLELSLKYAVNTHIHADHITGSGVLKQRLPAVKSVLSDESGAKADRYLSHLQVLPVGSLRLEARHTPGHTNGCMTLVMHEQAMAFTGDAVLIRGCGRTDFQQGSPQMLYQSVHTHIFSLPPHFRLYPAHDYTGQSVTSVEEERKHNKRLTRTEAEFVEIMNNLNLPYPKQIDKALPANLMCGIQDETNMAPPN